jgi:spermidine/putrescine transport system ATP-binding protein
VSLEIRRGEFFSLLGPSGCGKTTLLRIIAGFEMPDEGQVSLEGVNVLPMPPNKRHVNTVFQNYALFPHLSVFENVAFPLRIKKSPKNVIDSKVMEYLKLAQLESHAGKKPSQLSGGQKQRVAIVRALINEPKVLLLDEPLSALDAKLRQQLLIELDQIHDKVGITFIYVTHDQAEALSVSDRIAVMNQGNVLQVGTPHEIYESPATEFVAKFIGETNLYDGVVTSVEPVFTSQQRGLGFDTQSADSAVPSEYMLELDIERLGLVKVTTVDEVTLGQTVSFTIRPEKIKIAMEKPATSRGDINHFQGIVDEPIYSGFQTKFYVKVDGRAAIGEDGTSASDPRTVRVMKQHAVYSDEGPAIVWKDRVFLSWSANDGYVVGIKQDADAASRETVSTGAPK